MSPHVSTSLKPPGPSAANTVYSFIGEHTVSDMTDLKMRGRVLVFKGLGLDEASNEFQVKTALENDAPHECGSGLNLGV